MSAPPKYLTPHQKITCDHTRPPSPLINSLSIIVPGGLGAGPVTLMSPLSFQAVFNDQVGHVDH